MRRMTNSLAITADSIAVLSFVFWVITSFTAIGASIIGFVVGLPFTVRLVIAIILELAIAYAVGLLARRLIVRESLPLRRLPFKLVALCVLSLIIALTSTYNLARLIFADQLEVVWKYGILLILIVALLRLRAHFVQMNLSAAGKGRGDMLTVQQVIAATCGIVFLAFVIERSMIR